jgi:hypothetical protein
MFIAGFCGADRAFRILPDFAVLDTAGFPTGDKSPTTQKSRRSKANRRRKLLQTPGFVNRAFVFNPAPLRYIASREPDERGRMIG